MGFIKNLLIKLIGKNVSGKFETSKGKIGAVLYVIIVGIQTIPKAFGHPIEIPQEVFTFLEACGLGLAAFGIRDSVKS